jgi:hypothetical protein
MTFKADVLVGRNLPLWLFILSVQDHATESRHGLAWPCSLNVTDGVTTSKKTSQPLTMLLVSHPSRSTYRIPVETSRKQLPVTSRKSAHTFAKGLKPRCK